MMTKVDTHMVICTMLNELYARKNADYGDSFGKSFKEYGLTMACIRLEDKLNRIKALSKHEAQVSDESIIDTLQDLANYAIMTLVELAQDEPEKAPDRKQGNHGADCIHGSPHCQCLTCIHDNAESDDACCIRHCKRCSQNECPDYVKEG